MTREEMLNYLADKRQLTAPVAQAWNELGQAQMEAKKRKKKLWWCLIPLYFFCGALFEGPDDGLVGKVIRVLVFGAITFVSIKYTWNSYQKSKKALEQAQAIYSNEVNNPDYIAGKNGFPEKFYNYRDTYRLWKLISEGRALTLQEAYNLLETQQFQENQLSIQEEMKAMQADIASSSRVSAVANIATAYNSFKR